MHERYVGNTGKERPPALPERIGRAFLRIDVPPKSFGGKRRVCYIHKVGKVSQREGLAFKNIKVSVSWTLLVKHRITEMSGEAESTPRRASRGMV